MTISTQFHLKRRIAPSPVLLTFLLCIIIVVRSLIMNYILNQKFKKRFLQAVEKHPIIYDTKLKERSCEIKQRLDIAWNEIAKELNCDPLSLKKKWKIIRDTAAKKVREQQMCQNVSPYYLHEHIKFLYPFLRTTCQPVASKRIIVIEGKEDDVDNQYVIYHEQKPDDNEITEGIDEIDQDPIDCDFDVDGIASASKRIIVIEGKEDVVDNQYVIYHEQKPDDNEITEGIDEIDQDPIDCDFDVDAIASAYFKKSLPDPEEKFEKDNFHVYNPADDEKGRSKVDQTRSITQTSSHVASSSTENVNLTQLETIEYANKQFLYSLLPDLNQMSNSQMRHFKYKVLELIDDGLKTTET